MLTEAYFEFRFRKRRKKIENILSNFFEFSVSLKRLPGRFSQGSLYFVIADGKIVAIAKVINEFRLRKSSSNPGNFEKILTRSRRRFETGWEKYSKAYPYSLAPKPFYKSDNFIVIEYINAPKALEVLQKDPDRFREVIHQIVSNLRKLHQLGIIHGDVALYNCLLPDKENCIFIDMDGRGGPKFESQEERLIYDYLHLADRTIKFLPKKYKKIEPWISIFNTYIHPKFKNVDITVFKKKLQRLNKLDPDFRKLEKVFVKR